MKKNKWRIKLEQSTKSWGNSYLKLEKVLNSFNVNVGAEIGVAYGGNSEHILKHTKISRLYGVDPYSHIDGYSDPMNYSQQEFDDLFKYVCNKFKNYKDRYVLVRKFSQESIGDIPDKLDFVYIDADHSYEGVLRDLKLWFCKVKEGGILCGHDYNHPDFPGVKKAVDSFFKRFNWEVIDEGDGVWWVKKSKIGVTFIIPAYNCKKTIKESVDSIFNGNFCEGDEVVIVNDCSNDGTEKVLMDIEKKYFPKVRVISHMRNKGGGAARNTAVENSKNDLIFCLDSDNILEKFSIDKLKHFLINSGSDVVSFEEVRYFKKFPKVTHSWIFKESPYELSDIFCDLKFPGASGNYLYTKEIWKKSGGYPEFAGALDAWGFGFLQVANGAKMLAMPGTYYYHRYGIESYWVRESKEGRISLKALQIILPFIDLFSESEIQYLFKNRHSWFENNDKRPIRVGKKVSFLASLLQRLRRIL